MASNTLETWRSLEAQHSLSPSSTKQIIPLVDDLLLVKKNDVLACIKSFQNWIACGHDGIRAQNLLDAKGVSFVVVSTDFLEALTSVVSLWL